MNCRMIPMFLNALTAGGLCCAQVSAQFAPQWLVTEDQSPSGTDQATDVVVDDAGNIYATGFTKLSGLDYDYLTIKVSPSGEKLWSRHFDAGSTGTVQIDRALRIGLDGSGHVYVMGYSYSGGNFGAGPKYDFVTIKYAPNGDVVWTNVFNSVNDNDDFMSDAKVMPDGTVYAVGWSYAPVGQPTDASYTLVKINPDGQTAWSRFYRGPDDGINWLNAVVNADESGIFIGTTVRYTVGGEDHSVYSIVKYSPDGEQIEETVFVPPLPQFAGNGFTQVFDSAMDPSGSFVMCGRHNVDVGADGTEGEAFLMKVHSDGTLDWTAVNSTDETEEFRSVTMDSAGNVFATGAYNVVEPNGFFHADALVAAYDASGNFMWEHRSAGSALLFDGDGHVEINSNGELVASMRHLNNGTLEDMRVFVYDRMSGSILNTALFDASQDDYLFGMAISPDDRIILAGRTRAGAGDADMVVVSVYDPTQVPSCPADTTGDGTVDLADLNLVLGNFGQQTSGGDTNGDGVVDLADLNAVLGAFGTGCP